MHYHKQPIAQQLLSLLSNAFQIGMVRPNVVMQMLSKLTSTPLYIMENVKIKDDWKESLEINVDNEMTYASCEDETSSVVSENATHTNNDEEHNEPSKNLVH